MPALIRLLSRKWFLLVFISALVVGCRHYSKDDINAIRKLSRARAEAFNNGDAAGIAVHFTENAILMPPGKASMTGREAVEGYYQSIFDEYHTDLFSEYREVWVEGDLAYGRGYARVKLIPQRGGDTIFSESEYINILKRQPDGKWMTTHDIWNSTD
jgi:uncharacterized protein (TIGR02246 family)